MTAPQTPINLATIRTEQRQQRLRLAIIALPFAMALGALSIGTGSLAGYVHAKAAATLAQAEQTRGM